jgi:transcriptional regulator with XRE-family HTH domain
MPKKNSPALVCVFGNVALSETSHRNASPLALAFPFQRFAARLGISIPTLRKMENGDPSVSIGLWAETLWLLERMTDLDEILKKEVSLFDQMDAQSKPKRKRASKRTC